MAAAAMPRIKTQTRVSPNGASEVDHLLVTLADRDARDAIRILRKIAVTRDRRTILKEAHEIDASITASVGGDRYETAAQRIFAVGEARRRRLPRNLSSELHWEILLVLYLSYKSGARHTIGSVIKLSKSSNTTGLRAIDALEKAGFVNREQDEHDRRAFFLLLSQQGRRQVEHILAKAFADT